MFPIMQEDYPLILLLITVDKAAQWQSWITIYSAVVLKGILPPEHLHIWLLFVRACCILGQRIINKHEIVTADLLLLNFCRKFELLFGKEYCTPNLNLHLHLKDCLLDYGPAHGFWCYSFERYNGLLGSYHTNKKAIEEQIMRKFVSNQHLRKCNVHADPNILSLFQVRDTVTDSEVLEDNEVFHLRMMCYASLDSIDSFACPSCVVQLKPLREGVFCSTTIKDLVTLYKQLYPQHTVSVPPFYTRSGWITIGGQLIGSVMSGCSSNPSSVIMAFWPTNGRDLSNIDHSTMRVGVVQCYYKHYVILPSNDSEVGSKIEHILAHVAWKQRHTHEDWFGASATVTFTMNEPPSMCSYIQVQRIAAVCAYSTQPNLNIADLHEPVFVACPIPLKFCV